MGDGGHGHCLVLSPGGVAPTRMVGVSASVNLRLHHKVQRFSSGTVSPRWSRKKGRKTVVVWCCGEMRYKLCIFRKNQARDTLLRGVCISILVKSQ